MLNFAHMNLEVLGEVALPISITEGPLVLPLQVLSRRASSRFKNHEYLSGAIASSPLLAGETTPTWWQRGESEAALKNWDPTYTAACVKICDIRRPPSEDGSWRET
jgi:hypothetical protein